MYYMLSVKIFFFFKHISTLLNILLQHPELCGHTTFHQWIFRSFVLVYTGQGFHVLSSNVVGDMFLSLVPSLGLGEGSRCFILRTFQWLSGRQGRNVWHCHSNSPEVRGVRTEGQECKRLFRGFSLSSPHPPKEWKILPSMFSTHFPYENRKTSPC